MPAENDQAAVVQELFKRRESLDPDKRAVVDELAKRFNLSAPRDPNELPGYKEAEDWWNKQKDRPAQSFGEQAWEAAKGMAKAAVSPITSLKDIPGALYDWAKSGFRPAFLTQPDPVTGKSQIGPPDYFRQGNPAEETTAMLSGAALASLPAKQAAQAIARAPAAIIRNATSPGMPSIVGGAGEVMAGAGGLASGNPVGMAVGAGVGVRGAARIAKGLAERKAMLAERAVEESAARGKELAAEHRAGPQPTPAWQAIRDVQEAPALDLSPAEVDALPAQMARDYLDANRIRRGQKPPRAAPAWRAAAQVPAAAPPVAEVSAPPAEPVAQMARDYLDANRIRRQAGTQKPPRAEPIPAPEVAQAAGITLDGIAQGFGYKNFKAVKDARAQGVIQSQYERLVQQEVAKAASPPMQAAAPVVEAPAVPESSAPPAEPAQAAAEALRDLLAPESGAIPSPEPAPGLAPEQFKVSERADKVRRVADFLQKKGATYEQLSKVPMDDPWWNEAAKQAGVSTGTMSTTAVADTLFKIERAERARTAR